MRWLAARGAMILAVFTAAFIAPGAGAAGAADCWLLDEAALAHARAQGRCRDVFARAVPESKPAPARPAKAARRTPPSNPASNRASNPAPSLRAWLERLVGSLKPDKVEPSRSTHGGTDHLAYGRTERTPVQR